MPEIQFHSEKIIIAFFVNLMSAKGVFFPTFCSPHIGVGFAPAEGITRISGITCGQGH